MASEIKYRMADAVDILGRTPGVLRAMLHGLPETWIANNYGKDTFSPFDVVGHLLDADEVNWMPRLRMILEAGTRRAFEPFDRYAMYARFRGVDLETLLADFERVRRKNLADLAALELTDADLERCGMHPDLGEVRAGQLLATWVVHDLNHVHQVAKCMAYQYREAIGPWRPYVGVLPPA